MFWVEEIFIPLFTERLMLRAPKYSDVSDVFDICSHPDSCRYADWFPHKTKGETFNYISWLKKQAKATNRKGYTWFVECNECKKVIATISVMDIDASGSIATVGYTLAKEYQHKGYATEMLRAVLRFLFTDLNFTRVQAKVMVENAPSIRLLERVGMQREGLLRKGAFCKDKCVDVYLYSVLKDEFLRQKAPNYYVAK